MKNRMTLCLTLSLVVAARITFAELPEPVPPETNASANASIIIRSPIAMRALDSRRLDALAAKTRSSEDAVMCALRWLAAQQKPDGAWPGSAASTALAMTAFFANGEKPDSRECPEFGAVVLRGVNTLLGIGNAPPEGDSLPFVASALFEGYAATGDHALLEAGQICAMKIIEAQSLYGGWVRDVKPSASGNVIYTAWCVQALAQAHAKARDKEEWNRLRSALNHAHSFLEDNGFLPPHHSTDAENDADCPPALPDSSSMPPGVRAFALHFSNEA